MRVYAFALSKRLLNTIFITNLNSGWFDSVYDFSSSKKCQGHPLKVIIIITFIVIWISKKYLDLSKSGVILNCIRHYSDLDFAPT